MVLAYFRMLNIEFLNNELDVVTEQPHIIILDRKSALYMANNGKDIKQTKRIARIMHFLGNGSE